jgi:diguanylate cyclase (GGDEF)-like protein
MDDHFYSMPRQLRHSDAPASHPGIIPFFQPIVDLRRGTVFGHEALIRGPAGTALHSPLALLALAANESRLTEFELHCAEVILAEWGRQAEPGRLFVNMSADALTAAMSEAGEMSEAGDVSESSSAGSACWLERMLAQHGVAARDVTIELTEQRAAGNPEALRQAVKALHALGARVALDDFGDGRSSLRLWSELRPDYVKIDKYFSKDISLHADKLQTLRALKQIAVVFGTVLVAEGIEDRGRPARAARSLHRLRPGLPARPPGPRAAAVDPRGSPGRADSRPARDRAARAAPRLARGPAAQPVHHACADREPGHQQQRCRGHLPRPSGAACRGRGRRRPAGGIMNRQVFMQHYAQQYFKEIFGRKPCLLHANHAPRLVERDHDVDDLVGILMSQDQRYLVDGFIVTDNGRYVGLGTGEQLVRSVTEVRLEAARHANPLTFLPGNIPISQHIERLLQGGAEFVACYADLNSFKPFNDHYGYWRGDEMIRLVAKVMVAHCDAQRDFVGHVGGDDFVILFQSSDWQPRCAGVIDDFNRLARDLYDEADRRAGGIEGEDRQGVVRFTPLTTLSIGAVRIPPGMFRHAEDVASEAAIAKHEAKHAASGLTVREARVRG